jgi:hypothetical protein
MELVAPGPVESKSMLLIPWSLVIAFRAVFGFLLACVAAPIMRVLAWLALPKEGKSRAPALRAATLFPFAVLLWSGIIVAVQVPIDTVVFRCDPGAGDFMHIPLSGTYNLEITDDAIDTGFIVKRPLSGDYDSSEHTQIACVSSLQVSGSYILALAQDSPRNYLLLNAATGKNEEFDKLQQLKDAASKLGIAVKLEPPFEVLWNLRYNWFDWFLRILWLAVPVVSLGVLIGWIIKLRTKQSMTISDGE